MICLPPERTGQAGEADHRRPERPPKGMPDQASAAAESGDREYREYGPQWKI
jgi:hypothetical protein